MLVISPSFSPKRALTADAHAEWGPESRSRKRARAKNASPASDLSSSSLMSLPEEILLKILQEVAPRPHALAGLQTISRQFSRLARDNSLWRSWAPAEGLRPTHENGAEASLFEVFCGYMRQTRPTPTAPQGLPQIKRRLLSEVLPLDQHLLGKDPSALDIETSLWRSPSLTMPQLSRLLQTDASVQKRAAYAMRVGPGRNLDFEASPILPIDLAGPDLLASKYFAEEVVALFGPSFMALDQSLRDERRLAMMALTNWPALQTTTPDSAQKMHFFSSPRQARDRVDRMLSVRFLRALGPALQKDDVLVQRLVACDPRVVVTLLRSESCHPWQEDRRRIVQAAASLPYFYALPETQRWREDPEVAMAHYERFPASLSRYLITALSDDFLWLGALLNKTVAAFAFLPNALRNKVILSLVSDPFAKFTCIPAANRVTQNDREFLLDSARQAARVTVIDENSDRRWLEPLPKYLKHDIAFLKRIIEQRPYVFLGLTSPMRREPCLYKAALSSCPDLLTSMPLEVYDDLEAVLSALTLRPQLAIKLPNFLRMNPKLLSRFLPISKGHAVFLWSEHWQVARASSTQQETWLAGVTYPLFLAPEKQGSYPQVSGLERYTVLCEMRERLGPTKLITLSLPLVVLEMETSFSSRLTELFRNALRVIAKKRDDPRSCRMAMILERGLTLPSSFRTESEKKKWLQTYRVLCLFSLRDAFIPI